MNDSESYWFPAKRYGWGWGLPSHRMGWITMITYIVVVTAGAFVIDAEKRIGAYLAMVAVCTLGLLAICWMKGERPRWRWGDE